MSNDSTTTNSGVQVFDLTNDPNSSYLEKNYNFGSIDRMIQRKDSHGQLELCIVVNIVDNNNRLVRKELLTNNYIRQKYPLKLLDFYEKRTLDILPSRSERT